MDNIDGFLDTLEKDESMLLFGNLKRIARDVNEARILLKSQHTEIIRLKLQIKDQQAEIERLKSKDQVIQFGDNPTV